MAVPMKSWRWILAVLGTVAVSAVSAALEPPSANPPAQPRLRAPASSGHGAAMELERVVTTLPDGSKIVRMVPRANAHRPIVAPVIGVPEELAQAGWMTPVTAGVSSEEALAAPQVDPRAGDPVQGSGVRVRPSVRPSGARIDTSVSSARFGQIGYRSAGDGSEVRGASGCGLPPGASGGGVG